MYFNAYFKEMKIGAQREGRQSEQLCAVCSGPGCPAVASRKAVGTQTPHPCPRVPCPCPCVPCVPTSPCSAVPQAGRMRGDEEPGTALGLQGGSLAGQREVRAVSDGVLGSARL